MGQQFAAGLGGHAFAFDEWIVGQGGAQGLATAHALFQSLARGGHGHGMKKTKLEGVVPNRPMMIALFKLPAMIHLSDTVNAHR